MSDRTNAIQKHTADMLSVERHILEAVERQREDDALRGHLEANKVVIDIERVLKEHTAALENLAESYDAGPQSAFKKAVTEFLGVVAGLYDKTREHKVTRMLRDDYTALSLAAMGYTSYHAFGLAIGEERIAQLALKHLKDLTPLLVSISKVLPVVTVQEVAEENEFPVDREAGKRSVAATQSAWSHDVVERTAP